MKYYQGKVALRLAFDKGVMALKVLHVESGLGNQMLDYCEYLALKKSCPNEKLYIETMVYEIPEANEYISQWDGYKLDRVFKISADDVRCLFRPEQWGNILEYVKNSEFWKKNWNWPVYMCEAFQKEGLTLNNIRGNFENENIEWHVSNWKTGRKMPLTYRVKQTGIYSNIRRLALGETRKYSLSRPDELYYSGTEDALTGHRLYFKYNGNEIERIDAEIRKAFVFPTLTDSKNIEIAKMIKSCHAVAIHARWGDMLTANGKYYKSGYFKRSVEFIKKKVPEPVFFIFSNEDSIEWCKSHQQIFGLNFGEDKIYFVDWNKGADSYIDMNLMSMCSHNIITNSSFGWWGSYLNDSLDKITVSPEMEINTTHHF